MREDLVLPPHDRVQNDGRADVRDDQQELEQHPEIDLGCRGRHRRCSRPGRRERAGRAHSAGIDVMNVMMNSTPKIRAFSGLQPSIAPFPVRSAPGQIDNVTQLAPVA